MGEAGYPSPGRKTLILGRSVEEEKKKERKKKNHSSGAV